MQPNGKHPDIIDHLKDCDDCNIDITGNYHEYYCWACDKPLEHEDKTVHIKCSEYDSGSYLICMDCYSKSKLKDVEIKDEINNEMSKFIDTLRRFGCTNKTQ